MARSMLLEKRKGFMDIGNGNELIRFLKTCEDVLSLASSLSGNNIESNIILGGIIWKQQPRIFTRQSQQAQD